MFDTVIHYIGLATAIVGAVLFFVLMYHTLYFLHWIARFRLARSWTSWLELYNRPSIKGFRGIVAVTPRKFDSLDLIPTMGQINKLVEAERTGLYSCDRCEAELTELGYLRG
jgi:hypothetical protein